MLRRYLVIVKPLGEMRSSYFTTAIVTSYLHAFESLLSILDGQQEGHISLKNVFILLCYVIH